MMHDYDLAILGSGSAAFAAAIKARELGRQVLMVERETVGGTCVNIGCVPSKAILRAAELADRTAHPLQPGIRSRLEAIDLARMVAAKDDLVAQLRQQKYLDLARAYDWEIVRGTARFQDERTIAIDGKPLEAASYLVATGASPWIPPISGLAEHLTSTTALSLGQLPGRLAVIGANAIGLELGQAFQMLGAEVVLLEALDRIAPFEAPEISAALADRLSEQGMTMATGAQITRIQDGRVDAVVGSRNQSWEIDQVLVATGRRPNTADLGLERAGIEVDRRGAIIVDDELRTTNPRVWAAGDVTPSPQFVYVAAYEGTLAADNCLSGARRKVDLEALPRVTFTSPQIASVGLTEEQARHAGHEVKASLLPLAHVPRALVNRDVHGLFKLVADARDDRLLGAHVLAENAGDVILAATIAIKHRLPLAALSEGFAPYLTMAEGLKLAAQAFQKDVGRLSCCAG
ncbi:MAG: mercury(II) reductase [Cyanobacteria bacterium REEB65]|nr:mercury(II) reductase [Cyanobacteria bacterium REEB65]